MTRETVGALVFLFGFGLFAGAIVPLWAALAVGLPVAVALAIVTRP